MPNENGLFSDEEISTLVVNALNLKPELMNEWSQFRNYPEVEQLYTSLMLHQLNFEKIYIELIGKNITPESVVKSLSEYLEKNLITNEDNLVIFNECNDVYILRNLEEGLSIKDYTQPIPNRGDVFFLHVFLIHALKSYLSSDKEESIKGKVLFKDISMIMWKLYHFPGLPKAIIYGNFRLFLYKVPEIDLAITKIAFSLCKNDAIVRGFLSDSRFFNFDFSECQRLMIKDLNIFLFLINVLREKHSSGLVFNACKDFSRRSSPSLREDQFITQLNWRAAFEKHKSAIENPRETETILTKILGNEGFKKQERNCSTTGAYNAAQMITQHSAVIPQEKTSSISNNTNKKNEGNSYSKCIIM